MDEKTKKMVEDLTNRSKKSFKSTRLEIEKQLLERIKATSDINERIQKLRSLEQQIFERYGTHKDKGDGVSSYSISDPDALFFIAKIQKELDVCSRERSLDETAKDFGWIGETEPEPKTEPAEKIYQLTEQQKRYAVLQPIPKDEKILEFGTIKGLASKIRGGKALDISDKSRWLTDAATNEKKIHKCPDTGRWWIFEKDQPLYKVQKQGRKPVS